MCTVTPVGPTVGIVVQAPAAELDLATTGLLRALLAAAHRPGALVVLSMQGVVLLDSTALTVLLIAQARLEAAGGALVLVDVEDRVLRVLRLHALAEQLVCSTGDVGPLRPEDLRPDLDERTDQ